MSVQCFILRRPTTTSYAPLKNILIVVRSNNKLDMRRSKLQLKLIECLTGIDLNIKRYT